MAAFASRRARTPRRSSVYTKDRASELRSLLAGGVSQAVDHAGALDYLAYGKVHAPRTILRDVVKLPPGHFLRLDAQGLRVEKFWSVPQDGAAPVQTIEEAEERLDALL